MAAATDLRVSFNEVQNSVSTIETNLDALRNKLRSLEAKCRHNIVSEPDGLHKQHHRDEDATNWSAQIQASDVDVYHSDIATPKFKMKRNPLTDDSKIDISENSVERSSGDPSLYYQSMSHNGARTIEVSRLEIEVDSTTLPSDLTRRWKEGIPAMHNAMHTSSSVRSARSDRGSYGTRISSSAATSHRVHERWFDLYIQNEGVVDHTVADVRTLYSRKRKSGSTSALEVVAGTVTIADFCNADVNLSPYSFVRVVWDLTGLLLVLIDLFLIPLSIAWNLEEEKGSAEYKAFVFGIWYWSLDVLLTFNTSVMDQAGTVVAARGLVALRYIRTWLIFDLALLSIDLFMYISSSYSSMGFIRSARMIRMLRLIRGLRLVKLSKLSQTVEDVCETNGQVALTLILAVVRTMFGIFFLAHLLACMWFWLGRTGNSRGESSWIQFLTHRGRIRDEYAQCLAWTLGHLTANAVDVNIGPQSFGERFFMLCILLFAMIVIGYAVGKMTETIIELEKMNSEATRAKRTLQWFLKANEVPVDLSVRIIRFAVHKLNQGSRTTLEARTLGLLSPQLTCELIVCQRRKAVVIHPLFALIDVSYTPQVMLNVCRAFTLRMFSESEVVFSASMWADSIVITTQGTWILLHPSDRDRSTTGRARISLHSAGKRDRYSDPTWFAELSLYAKCSHRETLLASTFGDACELSGASFADAVNNCPSCVLFVYHYALAYVKHAVIEASDSDHIAATVSQEIVTNISKKLSNDVEQLKVFSSSSADRTTFMVKIYHRQLEIIEIVRALPWLFPEFDDLGTYSHFDQLEEQQRSRCAVLSIIYVHYDAYSNFTCDQPRRSRLTVELWAQLQRVYAWAAVGESDFCALLVLLAIRGLGKVEALVKLAPPEMRTVEKVVMNLVHVRRELVPSIDVLEHNMVNLIDSVMQIQATFNMAQLLQGENNPNELLALKNLVVFSWSDGLSIFKSYIVSMLGMMCAIRGADNPTCQLHMDRDNGKKVLQCIHCLQNLEYAEPRAIYWTYISVRAKHLGLPFHVSEDYVLARLACLIRAEPGDCVQVSQSWNLLSYATRTKLIEHFLADGIDEYTVFFGYLPAYLVNARNNPHIGLARALAMLAELLDAIEALGVAPNQATNTTVADLQNLAAFCLDVKNPLTFEIVGAHVTFAQEGDVLKAMLSHKMYAKLTETVWQEDSSQDKELVYTLKRMLRKSTENEQLLHKLMYHFDHAPREHWTNVGQATSSATVVHALEEDIPGNGTIRETTDESTWRRRISSMEDVTREELRSIAISASKGV